MRILQRFIGLPALLLACVSSGPAFASAQGGYITNIHLEGTRLIFWLDGAAAGATCNTAGQRYEVNPTTDVGKAQMSFLMSAYAMHAKIYVSGENRCLSDTELVIYMKFA